MALRHSQGFLEAAIAKMGVVGEAATDFALVSGGASADTITRTAGDFTAKFRKGDMIHVFGATDANDDVEALITAVSALTITLSVGVFTTGQAAGQKIVLASPNGGTWPDIYNGGTLIIYSGTRPTSASDDIGAASALITFSDMQFSAAQWDSTLKKAYTEAVNFSATAAAAGTATWFRLTAPGDNATGSSTTAKRTDGSVGVNVGDLQLKATAISVSDPVSVSSWKIYIEQEG